MNEANISIANALLEATAALQQGGVPEPRRDAGTLLAHVLGRDRTYIITNAEDLIDDASVNKFVEAVQRRAQGEPLQYITGYQEFFGLEYKVTPDVLIPRPETELLVEAGLNLIARSVESPFICDFGTGSGCIVVALLKTCAKARAVAVDISKAAILVAQTNAVRHLAPERVSFVVSDGFGAFHGAGPRFDLLVSNPPYVADSAMKGLQREVRDHEPAVALASGADGLSLIRRLLHEGAQYLKPGGYLLFEIGFDQGAAVRRMAESSGWSILDIQPDLQGIPRLVALQKPPR